MRGSYDGHGDTDGSHTGGPVVTPWIELSLCLALAALLLLLAAAAGSRTWSRRGPSPLPSERVAGSGQLAQVASR